MAKVYTLKLTSVLQWVTRDGKKVLRQGWRHEDGHLEFMDVSDGYDDPVKPDVRRRERCLTERKAMETTINGVGICTQRDCFPCRVLEAGQSGGVDNETFRESIQVNKDTEEMRCMRLTLSFFRGVIKSGEAWSDVCERMYNAAMNKDEDEDDVAEATPVPEEG